MKFHRGISFPAHNNEGGFLNSFNGLSISIYRCVGDFHLKTSCDIAIFFRFSRFRLRLMLSLSVKSEVFGKSHQDFIEKRPILWYFFNR